MTRSTVRLTMAQALVRYLCNQFTEIDGERVPLFAGVFAIFGHGNVTCLSEALEAVQDTLPTWRGQNEQSMALAAIGFAKAKRRRQIMVAASSIGPGATNMVTAAGLAHANRLPVLLLAGDTFANRRPDPVMQQVEHFGNPTITVNDAFKPVCRYWDRIALPEQIIGSLPQAVAAMLDPADCGPAFLSLCQDTQEIAYDYPEAFFAPTVWSIPRPRPDRDRLAEAVELLKTAKKPLIISGGGVRYSLAEETVAKFALDRGMPDRRDHRRQGRGRPRPSGARRPDRHPRLHLGQRAGGGGGRGAGDRHAAHGLHHRLLDRLQPRRPDHRHQRRPLGRHQAPLAGGGRRRPRNGGRARRGPRRLEGAGRLDLERPQADGRVGQARRRLPEADERAGADLCPGDRRGARRRKADRPDHHRRRRPAGRAGEGLAGEGAEHLRLRVRLLLHGLRDRGRLGLRHGAAGDDADRDDRRRHLHDDELRRLFVGALRAQVHPRSSATTAATASSTACRTPRARRASTT